MAHTAAPISTPENCGSYWRVPSATRDRSYTVQAAWSGRLAGWLECDCPDYWYRQRKTRTDCKHIAAVKALSQGQTGPEPYLHQWGIKPTRLLTV
jgi:hypothetical protein